MYFIYLTWWFYQQTKFTTILASSYMYMYFQGFLLEAKCFKTCKKHLLFWPYDVLNHVICTQSSLMHDNDKQNLTFFGQSFV